MNFFVDFNSSDFDLGLDDVHITIHSLKNSAKRGITLSIGDYSELRFQVFIKNGKDSMSFRIERSGGFSNNLTGILGEVFRGNYSAILSFDSFSVQDLDHTMLMLMV